jgi:hypothetical protein
MPLFEVEIDPSKLIGGVDGANRSLDKLSKGARGAGGSVVALQNVFNSFDSRNIIFSSAHLFSELGKLREDMRDVTSGFGAAVTSSSRFGKAFGTLGLIIKTNPLFTIATVLSAVATGMALFGQRTDETAQAFDKLGESMRRAQLDQRAADVFGLSGLGPAEARANAVVSGYKEMIGAGTRPSLGSLAQITGSDPKDVAQEYWNARQDEDALNYLLQGYWQQTPNRQNPFRNFGVPQRSLPKLSDPNQFEVSEDFAARYARQYYERYMGQANAIRSSEEASKNQPVAASATGSDFYARQVQGSIEATVGTLSTVMAQQQQALRAMDEMRNKAREVGEYLGDAFFDAARGATTLRQMLAGILTDFGRQAFRQAFGGLGSSLVGGFGTSAPQAKG